MYRSDDGGSSWRLVNDTYDLRHRSFYYNYVWADPVDPDVVYSAAEDLMRQFDARPHLGKHCHSFDSIALERLHGEHFARFVQLAQEHDPEHKFVNQFTQRLFGLGE